MEGTTSTSNEGSKMNKRNLEKYQQIKTKNVSTKDIDNLLDKNAYSFSLNCVACDVKTNIKTADNNANPVSVSSADTQLFNLEEILVNPPWLNVRPVTPEKVDIISKKRKKANAERKAKKEARELAEAQELEDKKQIENNRE